MENYSRTELICYMLGAIQSSSDFNIKTDDALLELDNILFGMKQLPMSKEERESIDRMGEQMEIFNIQMGMNRETQRGMGLHRKKH